MPSGLKESIKTVFRGFADDDIFSRVGVAKYHLFTEGAKFGKRVRKPKRLRDGDPMP